MTGPSPSAFVAQYAALDWDRLWQTLKKDAAGLVSVLVLAAEDGAPLMLAYMDQTAFVHTLATGKMHYHSRSRNALWQKGETSGHYQHVQSARVDCDADALLFYVRQEGVACHTGQRSCFYRELQELV